LRLGCSLRANLLKSTFHVFQNPIVPPTRRYWLAVSPHCAANADHWTAGNNGRSNCRSIPSFLLALMLCVGLPTSKSFQGQAGWAKENFPSSWLKVRISCVIKCDRFSKSLTNTLACDLCASAALWHSHCTPALHYWKWWMKFQL